ncbi:MAG TPA: OPT/YSL family transporter, partial [Gemmatimonadaceae bacterium]|nr:OPT/YSL family transporter [Gemmatimonadaceae bacterium]
VGVYLPISTSATMFMGGVVRWLAERAMTPEQRSGPAADSGPGVLLSSGLIAGGAITGIALAALAARDLTGGIDFEKQLGAFAASPLVAILAFLLLVATPLYLVARKGSEAQ